MKRFRKNIFVSFIILTMVFSGFVSNGVLISFALTQGDETEEPTVIEEVYGVYYEDNDQPNNGDLWDILEDYERSKYDMNGNLDEGEDILESIITDNPVLENWESASGYNVFYVYMKAGNGGYLYSYDGDADEDKYLLTPEDKDISHISFYYEMDELEALELTSVCSDIEGLSRFRVYNPNDEDVDFDYENVDNNDSGTETAIAGEYTFFYVDRDENAANTTKIMWDGGEAVKASNNLYCTYEVTIAKEWEDSEGDPMNEPVELDWSVTATVDQTQDSVTIDSNNPTATLDVELFNTFTVTEDVPEGYSVSGTGTYYIDDIYSEPSEIFKGMDIYKDGELVITNKVDDEEEDIPTLTVQKVLLDEQEEPILEDNTEFTVHIVGSNDHNEEYTFSVNDPLEFTIEDIGLGNFSFNEINIPEGYVFESMDPDGTIEFDGSSDVTVTITNMLEEEEEEEPTGTIIINKEVYDMLENSIEDDTEFEVTVEPDEGLNNPYTLSQDQPITITGLDLDTEYTITESEMDGYMNYGPITVEASEFTEGNDYTVEVTINNFKEEEEEEPTYLVINKEVVGEELIGSGPYFYEFTITNTEDSEDQTSVLVQGGYFETILLDIGTYTIVEEGVYSFATDEQVEVEVPNNLELDIENSVDGEFTITSENVEGDPLEITVTNTFTEEEEPIDEDDDDEDEDEDTNNDDEDEDEDEDTNNDDDDEDEDDNDGNIEDIEDTTIEPLQIIPSIPVIIPPVEEPIVDEPIVEEPIETIPNEPAQMPDLPFTGGALPIELALTGLGAMLVTSGMYIKKKK